MEKVKISKINIIEKILKIALKILYDILMLFCVVLILAVIWQRATNSDKSIFGYKLFRIISGSMVPEYNIDEVVISKDIDVKDLKIGDIVVYRGKIGDLNGKLIMHEVIDINQIDENLFFHVKGIQNNTGDPEVSDNQIVGKVIFKSQILTYVYSLATSAYSSFVIIMILVINVFVSFRYTKRNAKVADKGNDTKEMTENKDVRKNIDNDIDDDEYEVVRYRLKDYENSIKIIRHRRNMNKKNNNED